MVTVKRIAIVILVLGFCCSCEPVDRREEQPTAPKVEKEQLPTWDLEWKDAPEISPTAWLNTDSPLTLAQFRDKKFVLLEFWWTTCPHCVAELSRMKSLYSYFGGRIQFITIVKDKKDIAEKFIKEQDIRYPVGIDGEMKTFSAYAMKFVPFAYLINPKGVVVWQGSPHYLTVENIQEILDLSE